jgi:hypothetical protein
MRHFSRLFYLFQFLQKISNPWSIQLFFHIIFHETNHVENLENQINQNPIKFFTLFTNHKWQMINEQNQMLKSSWTPWLMTLLSETKLLTPKPADNVTKFSYPQTALLKTNAKSYLWLTFPLRVMFCYGSCLSTTISAFFKFKSPMLTEA